MYLNFFIEMFFFKSFLSIGHPKELYKPGMDNPRDGQELSPNPCVVMKVIDFFNICNKFFLDFLAYDFFNKIRSSFSSLRLFEAFLCIASGVF